MVLPDVLERGLKVVFCGTAVGPTSAQVGAYYAGPGNQFWDVLFRLGVTPRWLRPDEFKTLLGYGEETVRNRRPSRCGRLRC